MDRDTFIAHLLMRGYYPRGVTIHQKWDAVYDYQWDVTCSTADFSSVFCLKGSHLVEAWAALNQYTHEQMLEEIDAWLQSR